MEGLGTKEGGTGKLGGDSLCEAHLGDMEDLGDDVEMDGGKEIDKGVGGVDEGEPHLGHGVVVGFSQLLLGDNTLQAGRHLGSLVDLVLSVVKVRLKQVVANGGAHNDLSPWDVGAVEFSKVLD